LREKGVTTIMQWSSAW